MNSKLKRKKILCVKKKILDDLKKFKQSYICDKYKLSSSTVSDIKKNEQNIIIAFNENIFNGLNNDVVRINNKRKNFDQTLITSLSKLRENNIPLSGIILKEQAILINNSNGSHRENFKASDDETALFYKKLPNKSYIIKSDDPRRKLKENKEKITVLLCCSTQGEKIKPLFKKKMRRDLRNTLSRFDTNSVVENNPGHSHALAASTSSVISDEAGFVDTSEFEAFSDFFRSKEEKYSPLDIYNCDETPVFLILEHTFYQIVINLVENNGKVTDEFPAYDEN
ncbi:hypothetical protein A3Q56_00142 [Intoshia linei]|uniref:HTH psq-type domain-containing protein n=1 Tax=Intoshia linei TaxID=1819745 RepID=A0A177BCR9_9BILA|nr:hypothetical protein A3Q56_00142 [Intoshia linei]